MMYPEAIAFLNLLFLLEIEMGRRIRKLIETRWGSLLGIGLFLLLSVVIFSVPNTKAEMRVMYFQALVMTGLAVITAIYAWHTGRMAQETKNMADATRLSAEQAAKTAEATEKLAKEAEAQRIIQRELRFKEDREKEKRAFLKLGLYNEIEGNASMATFDERTRDGEEYKEFFLTGIYETLWKPDNKQLFLDIKPDHREEVRTVYDKAIHSERQRRHEFCPTQMSRPERSQSYNHQKWIEQAIEIREEFEWLEKQIDDWCMQ